jgi:hypothetical protein
MSNIFTIHNLVIAVVAALVNLVLSLIVPMLFKNTNQPMLLQIKQNYLNNRHTLTISTIIVFVFVYFSLIISPTIEKHVISKLASLSQTHQLVQ